MEEYVRQLLIVLVPVLNETVACLTLPYGLWRGVCRDEEGLNVGMNLV